MNRNLGIDDIIEILKGENVQEKVAALAGLETYCRVGTFFLFECYGLAWLTGNRQYGPERFRF